jgi:hypothetical protein
MVKKSVVSRTTNRRGEASGNLSEEFWILVQRLCCKGSTKWRMGSVARVCDGAHWDCRWRYVCLIIERKFPTDGGDCCKLPQLMMVHTSVVTYAQVLKDYDRRQTHQIAVALPRNSSWSSSVVPIFQRSLLSSVT